MDYLHINSGAKLNGQVQISGAKNAALPILSATLLSRTPVIVQNLPNVTDVKTFAKLLEHLGAIITWENPNSAIINTQHISHTKALYDIVRKMRASILVLGALLARFGHCEVSLPGGCAIGARPVDLHIAAMEKMGANIHIQGGYIIASAPKGLRGAEIMFDKITVTGAENIIMAAALAKGRTRIINAAREPEVVQLCEVLQQAGIEIHGIGTSVLEILGTDKELLELKPCTIIPDRIEAGTYLCAAAITKGNITLTHANPSHLVAVIEKLRQIGFHIESNEHHISIASHNEPQGFELITTEHPGFPTDMQAQFMSLATQCQGTSVIQERLFENRFMHVSELQRLGAHITLNGNTATIKGNTRSSPLVGADVMATDLRASSALVLAGLIAQGSTNVHRIYHLDRGYEHLEQKLSSLGAHITRKHE